MLAQRLESLHSAGVEQLPQLTALPLPEVPARTPDDNRQQARDNSATAPTSENTDAYRSEQLRILSDEVRSCTQCPTLVESRTQTVFGVGNIRPRLCFFGEAPGRDEDVQGEPFVGAAGQLLNRIIQAMTLTREQVYILNVLKCRPPGNRNPEPAEVECCLPFFERQLQILQPEFICCLGAYAAKTLLDSNLSVGRMRGQFFDYDSARVMVTYHPAYLLRNESAKRSTWDDMQMLMAEMGLSVPKR
jgi:uracil-DNA glycosylase